MGCSLSRLFTLRHRMSRSRNRRPPTTREPIPTSLHSSELVPPRLQSTPAETPSWPFTLALSVIEEVDPIAPNRTLSANSLGGVSHTTVPTYAEETSDSVTKGFSELITSVSFANVEQLKPQLVVPEREVEGPQLTELEDCEAALPRHPSLLGSVQKWLNRKPAKSQENISDHVQTVAVTATKSREDSIRHTEAEVATLGINLTVIAENRDYVSRASRKRKQTVLIAVGVTVVVVGVVVVIILLVL